jgi:hypothetical protein
LLDDEQLHAGPVAGFDHPIRAGESERERLFDHDMLAVRSPRNDMVSMVAALGQDDHDVNSLLPHHLVHVQVPRHREAVADGLSLLFRDVADGREACSTNLVIPEQFRVSLGDAPAANKSKIEHGVSGATLGKRRKLKQSYVLEPPPHFLGRFAPDFAEI